MSACVEYTLSMEEFMSFTSCSRSTSSSGEGGRMGERWEKVSDSESIKSESISIIKLLMFSPIPKLSRT